MQIPADSIGKILDVNLDESDISGASNDSNVDENWELRDNLLWGVVEDDEDEWDLQGTAGDHHQALLHDLGPQIDVPCGSGNVLDLPIMIQI